MGFQHLPVGMAAKATKLYTTGLEGKPPVDLSKGDHQWTGMSGFEL